jgi:hypothetical protein
VIDLVLSLQALHLDAGWVREIVVKTETGEILRSSPSSSARPATNHQRNARPPRTRSARARQSHARKEKDYL